MILFRLSYADGWRKGPSFETIVRVCVVMRLGEELATGIAGGEKYSRGFVD